MSPRLVLLTKEAVGVVCAWEVVAIRTGRIPTVSALCGRHRALIPLVLGGLAWHLTHPKGTVPGVSGRS